jgi:hypothetical protein
MNNNQQCFYPLRDALLEEGFDVRMMVLPNHGEKRDEVKNLDEALIKFDQEISPLLEENYVVLAFSQGAQYFQLWLNTFSRPRPLSMVLLAPAVFINFHGAVERLVHFLPGHFVFKSKMPRMFRRYHELYYWEYRLLFSGVSRFAEIRNLHGIPTQVMIDPKDELVNAKKVLALYQQMGAKTEVIKRKKLKLTLGRQHIIFHPDYFGEDEWKEFIHNISRFLKRS